MSHIKGTFGTRKEETEQDLDFLTIYGYENHQETKRSTKLKIVKDNRIEDIINCFNATLDWGYHESNYRCVPKTTNSSTLVNSSESTSVTNSGLRNSPTSQSIPQIRSSPVVNLAYPKRRGQKRITKGNSNAYQLKLTGGNVTKSFNRWSLWNTIKVSSSDQAIPKKKRESFGSSYFENIWNKTKKVFREVTKSKKSYVSQMQSYTDFAKEYDDNIDDLIQYRQDFFTKTARKPPQGKKIHPIFDDFYHSLYIEPNKQVNINRIPILDRLYERIDKIRPKIPLIRKQPEQEKPPIITIPNYLDYQLAKANNANIVNVTKVTEQGKKLSNRLRANMKDFVIYQKQIDK